ncbi:flavodoxin family protein [Patulibacter sp. SYSU D01012]|uniref:flavodoxin family protein n=1 Tax=Patulibacter sp. SYSU D01012 TaxID=2817381 RepID=UPI001B317AAE|nr:flavodoxin family protein [Patulibacter sp. SYSU D01012]
MTPSEPAVRPAAAAAPITPVAVAVVFDSGWGHTRALAHAVADGAAAAGARRVDLVPVAEVDDDAWRLLQDADAIVFGSPTYMGGASARFRAFAEATSQVVKADFGWRDKVAAGFTNSGCMSGDKLTTLIGMAVLAAQHAMVWVGVAQPGGWNVSTGTPADPNRLGSWLGAMAQADVDLGPDVVPPPADLGTAAHLGGRVTATAQALARGRAADGAGRA